MNIPETLKHDSPSKLYVTDENDSLVFGMSLNLEKPFNVKETSIEIVKRYNRYWLLIGLLMFTSSIALASILTLITISIR
ncbi:MAG: hypothetical protein V4538_15505 [Bacteroidota bacterium]